MTLQKWSKLLKSYSSRFFGLHYAQSVRLSKDWKKYQRRKVTWSPLQHLSFAAQESLQFKVFDAQHRLPLVHRTTPDVLRRRREVRDECGRQQGEVRNLLEVLLHVFDLAVPAFVLAFEADDEAVRGSNCLLSFAQVNLNLCGLFRELVQTVFEDGNLEIYKS